MEKKKTRKCNKHKDWVYRPPEPDGVVGGTVGGGGGRASN